MFLWQKLMMNSFVLQFVELCSRHRDETITTTVPSPRPEAKKQSYIMDKLIILRKMAQKSGNVLHAVSQAQGEETTYSPSLCASRLGLLRILQGGPVSVGQVKRV
ncbi:hypothetical protein GRJ2_001408000 [Grus japonensis]|uniref:Uncharacterized protein n=1 Tax=Grus japonensis TaxID=30415 RepID=A0ABC9WXY2_GRUJA